MEFNPEIFMTAMQGVKSAGDSLQGKADSDDLTKLLNKLKGKGGEEEKTKLIPLDDMANFS